MITKSNEMEFRIERIGNYSDVDVIVGNNTISLGLFNLEQRMNLAKTLKEAMLDLLDKSDYEELMGLDTYQDE